MIGKKFRDGIGIPRDYLRAAKWFRKSADQGDPEAQFDLGLMYEEGAGVEKDKILAHMWKDKAQKKGYVEPPDSKYWLRKPSKSEFGL